eukprot:CAMPEP_0183338496 /NCGR_PEP_ID=MMETSP0164_2-20130417/5768_1 /TAXON_ID=221442 /ORGANISM="Coccolithus pelagicus ssp braarudi, Strain PLY182g" /LENGTH=231 /DNA_ID=CAMNT_0025508353 /DNA_START=48 /DNA_END=743 /DNA_ORIENTATION=-
MTVATLVLGLIFVLLFLCRGAGKSRGNKLVLFGPEGGGKTALAMQIRFGRASPTLTSMQSTAAMCTLPGETIDSPPGPSVELVDVPGSGRLRVQLLAEAGSAGVLACVLDATSLQRQCKEAAGMIFDVLTNDLVVSRALPLLVVVNKNDVRGSASLQAARSQLESEVQKVRLARTTMTDTSNKTEQARGIADASAGSFSFDQLATPVEFMAASATQPNLRAFVKAVSRYVP